MVAEAAKEGRWSKGAMEYSSVEDMMMTGETGSESWGEHPF